MSDHLRLTPDQYSRLTRASLAMCLSGSFALYQRRLADAVRPADADLAKLVAGLAPRQVRALRGHFQLMRDQTELPAERPAACELTFSEWRAVARAYDLIQLRGPGGSLHGHIVTEVAESEPALAAKLCRLDEAQVEELCKRVKSCKRVQA